MRAVGIIPCRMASTRFPGKPLAMINGVPMVRRVYEAVKKTEFIYPIYVATPDQEIIDYCQSQGIPVIVTSGECGNGTERCNDAMRQLAARDPDEVVINIQGDEPMVRPESLDALVRAFDDPLVQIASLYFRAPDYALLMNENRVKVTVSHYGKAAKFSRRYDAYTGSGEVGIHVGVYGYRRPVLAHISNLPRTSLEQTAWLDEGWQIRMVKTEHASHPVDVPGDIEGIK
jgi:3-deoxy-manno-octulosonate cytidylyltransferase (CMP-KDO synthetase)